MIPRVPSSSRRTHTHLLRLRRSPGRRNSIDLVLLGTVCGWNIGFSPKSNFGSSIVYQSCSHRPSPKEYRCVDRYLWWRWRLQWNSLRFFSQTTTVHTGTLMCEINCWMRRCFMLEMIWKCYVWCLFLFWAVCFVRDSTLRISSFNLWYVILRIQIIHFKDWLPIGLPTTGDDWVPVDLRTTGGHCA